MDTTRVFVAIEIGEPARSTLRRILATMQQELEQVRWTRDDQLHLTLKFLGEVDNRELPEICQRVQACSQQHEAFGVEVQGTGSFPKDSPARVVWAGIGQGTAQLQSLQAALEESFSEMGFAKESRQFTPHLTLGRVGRGVDHTALEKSMTIANGRCSSRFEVDELVLMASDREKGRVVYHPIEHFELA